jgi:hypothetical protein
MSIGPCMCGDPYCSSCGDPSLAKMEEAIEALTERLINLKLDEDELWLFEKMGKAAVEAQRECMTNRISTAREDDGQYIEYLESQLAILKDTLEYHGIELKKIG